MFDLNIYDERRWTEEAKCAKPGTKPEDWDSKSTRGGPNVPPNARKRALALCHECPVMVECAKETLSEHGKLGYFPSGVIRAGIEIGGFISGPKGWGRFKKAFEEIVENDGYSSHQECLVKEYQHDLYQSYVEGYQHDLYKSPVEEYQHDLYKSRGEKHLHDLYKSYVEE